MQETNTISNKKNYTVFALDIHIQFANEKQKSGHKNKNVVNRLLCTNPNSKSGKSIINRDKMVAQ